MIKRFEQRFNIADVILLLDSDVQIERDVEFLEFETSEAADYRIRFRETAELTDFHSEVLFRDIGVCLFCVQGTYVRQFFGTGNEAYATCYCNWNEKSVTVKYLKTGLKNILHTNGAFFHIAWEEIMLQEHRLILHACCVESALGGILFSGISGIGKSTQGDLWCRYEGAKLINGDRPILYKKNRWIACGSPYAGSSQCHINARTDVRAIVMLAKAKVCSIRRLSIAEAFRRVFSQLTVSVWDPGCVKSICDLAEQLVADVPVYELACTPEREAVNLLKGKLSEENL